MATERTFVLVTSSFPVRNDGSEAAGSFVADLAEALSMYVNVRVVAPGLMAARERWSHRVEVVRYAAPSKPLSTLKPWRPEDLRWTVRVWRGGLAATHDAIDDDTTHVLALWGLPCGEWARRAACKRRIDYSVWMLGSDVWSLGRIPILRGCLARVMRAAQHAYADGYELAESAQRIGKVPVAFVPSTRRIGLIDPPWPRTMPPYRLLFLGRWHPNKGIDLLLDALALLGDDDWQRIECVEIQGGGPLETLVRERVAALRIAGRPVEAGHFLTKSDAEAAIVRADWILIPSRVESIPVVFSDAMKLSRPVIATPVGDLPRLVGEMPHSGVLADAVSAESVCSALREALVTVPQQYVAGAQRMAACFDLTAIAERLLVETATR